MWERKGVFIDCERSIVVDDLDLGGFFWLSQRDFSCTNNCRGYRNVAHKKSEQHSTGQNCTADVKCQRRSRLVGRQSKFTVEISHCLIFAPPTPLLLQAADMSGTFPLLMSFNKA